MAVYSIIFSPTGGTRKVADIISKEFSDNISIIDLTQVNTDFSKFQLQNEDIAIISIPSFGGRAPQVAIERLKQIKSGSANAILVCVYGNRAYEDTLVEMQDVAQECGFNVLSAISAVAEHSIVRLYGANRPNDKDIKELKAFVQKIKESMVNPTDRKLSISGNRPYRSLGKVGLVPSVTKNCKNCGQCSQLCPMGAISKTDVKKVDKNKCISCMRCVSICPHNARKISKIMTAIISFVLKKVCSDRKENELFI